MLCTPNQLFNRGAIGWLHSTHHVCVLRPSVTDDKQIAHTTTTTHTLYRRCYHPLTLFFCHRMRYCLCFQYQNSTHNTFQNALGVIDSYHSLCTEHTQHNACIIEMKFTQYSEIIRDIWLRMRREIIFCQLCYM